MRAGTYIFNESDCRRCHALIKAALAAGFKVNGYADRWKFIVEVTP